MLTRPLTPDDADAVLAIRAAVEAADGLPWQTLPEEVADLLDGDGTGGSRHLVGVLDDGGGLAAYGWVLLVRDPSTSGRVALLDLAVDPARAGRGLGRRLLANLVAQADRSLRAMPGGDGPPPVLAVLVEARQAAAAHLLARAAFAPAQHEDDLVLQSGTPPPAAARRSADVAVVAWHPGRSREAKGVHRGAFARRPSAAPITEAAWQDLTTSPGFATELSAMALRPAWADGRSGAVLVGLLVASRWPDDDAWIDVVAVAHGASGRGVATALLRRAVDGAAATGVARVRTTVGTADPPAAHRMCASAGFERVQRMHRWERPLGEGARGG